MPLRLQATHAPVHAAAQQTPSAQCVDVQSPSATQPAPFAFFGREPQLLFVQTAGEAHSLPPVVHVERQSSALAAPPQLYGVQSTVLGATHAPWPSQAEAGWKLAPLQDAALHCVPAG